MPWVIADTAARTVPSSYCDIWCIRMEVLRLFPTALFPAGSLCLVASSRNPEECFHFTTLKSGVPVRPLSHIRSPAVLAATQLRRQRTAPTTVQHLPDSRCRPRTSQW